MQDQELRISLYPDDLYVCTKKKDRIVLQHLIGDNSFTKDRIEDVQHLANLHNLYLVVTDDIAEF